MSYDPNDPWSQPLRVLRERLAQRELSAESLVTDALARIRSLEPDIHAWQHLDPDHALAQARHIDAGDMGRALAGVPIGVKDLLDTADMPTTYGSVRYAGHRPMLDAAGVALSRAQGAVIIGKTVTTEYAAFQPGPTVNPRSPAGQPHTPGGSSSGSAAAVAAGMVPIAFGTQTAGSIVRPAAFCGVVGYKPSPGTLSAVGSKPLAPSLDTLGVLARRVDDAAYFIAALTHGSIAPLQALRGLCVGLCRTPYWDHVDADGRQAWDDAARLLSRAGARLTDVELPPACLGLNDAQIIIMGYEAAAAFEADLQHRPEGFSPAFLQLLAQGREHTARDYAEAGAQAARARQAVARLFASVDVLLAPSAPGQAPEGLAATGDPVMNRFWTLLGNPCVHVPVGVGSRRMPLGVTLVGDLYDDASALAAAHLLEQAVAA